MLMPMYCIPLNLPRSLRLDPMYITLTFNSTTTLHPVTSGDRFSRTHSSRGIYFKPLPCRFYIIIIIISEPESLATSSPTEPTRSEKESFFLGKNLARRRSTPAQRRTFPRLGQRSEKLFLSFGFPIHLPVRAGMLDADADAGGAFLYRPGVIGEKGIEQQRRRWMDGRTDGRTDKDR